MKKFLSVLLAVVMLCSFCAVFAAADLPEDLDSLPELTLNEAIGGTIANEESVWYQFTPEEDGIYGFLTTGGYDRSTYRTYDYLYVRPIVYDAAGKPDYRWQEVSYQAGETYYVQVAAWGLDGDPVAYTVTPKFYTYAEPLKAMVVSEPDARKGLKSLLKGSEYTIADIEILEARGNLWQDSAGLLYDKNSGITDVDLGQTNAADLYSAGYLDIFFRDGTYTMVTVDTHDMRLIFSDIKSFFTRISDFFTRIGTFFSDTFAWFKNLFAK